MFTKMNLFECYTFEENIYHKTGFARRQPKGYYDLFENLRRVGNLFYNFKKESKKGPIYTVQIVDPPQGGGHH